MVDTLEIGKTMNILVCFFQAEDGMRVNER